MPPEQKYKINGDRMVTSKTSREFQQYMLKQTNVFIIIWAPIYEIVGGGDFFPLTMHKVKSEVPTITLYNLSQKVSFPILLLRN